MNMPATRQTTNQVAKQDQVGGVAVLMKQYKSQIEAALPKHVTADRLMRVCLTELRKNPSLQKCDPMSFLGSVVTAASLGLEPGSALGQCYLIPYGNECQFQIGYRGMIDIARRSGNIISITAWAVYEGDEFTVVAGTEESLIHKPKFETEVMTHCYAVAKLVGGGVQFCVMSRKQLDSHRERYSKNNPAWKTAFEEMCKKTVIKKLFKLLPTSIELARAMESEEVKAHEILDADYVQATPKVDPKKLAELYDEEEAAAIAQDLQMFRNKFAKLLTEGKKAPAPCGDNPAAWAQKASLGELAAAVHSMSL